MSGASRLQANSAAASAHLDFIAQTLQSLYGSRPNGGDVFDKSNDIVKSADSTAPTPSIETPPPPAAPTSLSQYLYSQSAMAAAPPSAPAAPVTAASLIASLSTPTLSFPAPAPTVVAKPAAVIPTSAITTSVASVPSAAIAPAKSVSAVVPSAEDDHDTAQYAEPVDNMRFPNSSALPSTVASTSVSLQQPISKPAASYGASTNDAYLAYRSSATSTPSSISLFTDSHASMSAFHSTSSAAPSQAPSARGPIPSFFVDASRPSTSMSTGSTVQLSSSFFLGENSRPVSAAAAADQQMIAAAVAAADSFLTKPQISIDVSEQPSLEDQPSRQTEQPTAASPKTSSPSSPSSLQGPSKPMLKQSVAARLAAISTTPTASSASNHPPPFGVPASTTDSFAYRFRKERSAYLEKVRTGAASLALAAAGVDHSGPVNPAMAAKLSQLALAANSSVENMEQGNEKERLQRIQAAKARPREVRLTADDIQKLRAVVAEASGGDADVAKPVMKFLAKRDDDLHLKEYANFAKQLEETAKRRRAAEAEEVERAEAARMRALIEEHERERREEEEAERKRIEAEEEAEWERLDAAEAERLRAEARWQAERARIRAEKEREARRKAEEEAAEEARRQAEAAEAARRLAEEEAFAQRERERRAAAELERRRQAELDEAERRRQAEEDAAAAANAASIARSQEEEYLLQKARMTTSLGRIAEEEEVQEEMVKVAAASAPPPASKSKPLVPFRPTSGVKKPSALSTTRVGGGSLRAAVAAAAHLNSNAATNAAPAAAPSAAGVLTGARPAPAVVKPTSRVQISAVSAAKEVASARPLSGSQLPAPPVVSSSTASPRKPPARLAPLSNTAPSTSLASSTRSVPPSKSVPSSKR